jgi:hypothetical protein
MLIEPVGDVIQRDTGGVVDHVPRLVASEIAIFG